MSQSCFLSESNWTLAVAPHLTPGHPSPSLIPHSVGEETEAERERESLAGVPWPVWQGGHQGPGLRAPGLCPLSLLASSSWNPFPASPSPSLWDSSAAAWLLIPAPPASTHRTPVQHPGGTLRLPSHRDAGGRAGQPGHGGQLLLPHPRPALPRSRLLHR